MHPLLRGMQLQQGSLFYLAITYCFVPHATNLAAIAIAAHRQEPSKQH